MNADTNYSINPWMNPKARTGDDVDPSPMLSPVQILAEFEAFDPVPTPAGEGPRLLGYERTQPGITDVLGVGPNVLMQDTPTRQDSGMYPSGTNW